MEISPLQKERLKYQPKLPGMLRHGISDICVKEGEETASVSDQDKIRESALFSPAGRRPAATMSSAACMTR